MHLLIQLLVLAVLCLGSATSAFAIPTLSISSSGNGIFVLHARDLHSIGGITLFVNYDTATLANPRIGKGPLAASATAWTVNTTRPGIIILPLAATNGFPASGVIATITFDVLANPPGIISSLKADMVNMVGAHVSHRIDNPYWKVQDKEEKTSSDDTKENGDTTGLTKDGDTTVTPETIVTASGLSSGSTTAGSGAPPPESGAIPSAQAEEPVAATPEAAAEMAQDTTGQASEAAADAPGSGSGATGTLARASATPDDDAAQPLESLVREEKLPSPAGYQSVLEQLRGFTGPKSPKSLTEIFSRHSTPGVRQEPAIGLTDGSSKLRLVVTPHSADGKAPNFSLSGAKLLGLKPEPDGAWVVEVLPEKGSYSVTLTILQGNAVTAVPLLVAPPLAGGEQPKLTESGFAQFLSERGTEKSPRFDLNGDGRRDYMDDYIFTANYLAGKETGQRKDDSRKAVTVGGRGSLSGEGSGKAK